MVSHKGEVGEAEERVGIQMDASAINLYDAFAHKFETRVVLKNMPTTSTHREHNFIRKGVL